MSLTRQAASGVRWTSVATIVTVAMEISRSVVLARFLSADDFGLMAMVMVAIGLAQSYLDLGISAAIIHYQDVTREQLSSLYWLNVLVGLVVCLLLWLCTPLIALIFREPRLIPLLNAVCAVFLIIPLGSQFEILLQKELSFRTLSAQDILASIASLIVAIACATAGFGVWTLVWSFFAGLVLKTALLMRTGWQRFRPQWHFRRADLRGFLSFGFYQMGERSINYFGERLDQILIGPLLGAHALGLYTFAFNLTVRPVSRINPIVTRVAFPIFSKVQHDTERLRRGYVDLLNLLTMVNAPLLLGLAAVAPVAVPLVFGPKWSESIVLVQILCLVNVGRSAGNPIGTLQLAKGRADLGFWWNVAFLFISVPAIYAGARYGQALGVALALLAIQVVLFVPCYLFLVRPLIGRCAAAYNWAVLEPMALSGLMALIVMMVPVVYPLPAVGALIAQIAIGAAIYLTWLVTVKRHKVDRLRAVLLT